MLLIDPSPGKISVLSSLLSLSLSPHLLGYFLGGRRTVCQSRGVMNRPRPTYRHDSRLSSDVDYFVAVVVVVGVLEVGAPRMTAKQADLISASWPTHVTTTAKMKTQSS